MPTYEFEGKRPKIDPSVYVASNATIIGDVTIGKDSSVWFNCVIRGDDNTIKIGEETNIQDTTTLHSDPRQVLSIGNRVTIGHRCIVHGCTIEDDCLIGMGAIVMTGATIGQGSVVAAGAVVTEDQVIPPFSRVTGIPGTVTHTYEKEVVEKLHSPAQNYMERARKYAGADKLKKINSHYDTTGNLDNSYKSQAANYIGLSMALMALVVFGHDWPRFVLLAVSIIGFVIGIMMFVYHKWRIRCFSKPAEIFRRESLTSLSVLAGGAGLTIALLQNSEIPLIPRIIAAVLVSAVSGGLFVVVLHHDSVRASGIRRDGWRGSFRNKCK